MGYEIKNIPLTQCYLEMARSMIYANVRYSKDQQAEEQVIDIESLFYIAFASLTTIYSYMAVESFMNYSLYELWKQSRLAQTKIEELNEKYPKLKCIANYDEFYLKYGHIDNFIKLKNAGLGDMREKIKVLCENFGFKQIHEVNQTLWQDFLGLLEKTRDFLIHPNPEEIIFTKYCKELTKDSKLYHEFPRIASEIIKHFYSQANTQPPEFLESNKLFFIPEIVKMQTS